MEFEYAKNRKGFNDALTRFKALQPNKSDTEGRPQVMLLLIKQGANGLNITGVPSCRVVLHLCRLTSHEKEDRST